MRLGHEVTATQRTVHSLWDNINTCDLRVMIGMLLLTSFEATFVPIGILARHTEWTNVAPAATHSMRTLAI